jgi:hypothetical protein
VSDIPVATMMTSQNAACSAFNLHVQPQMHPVLRCLSLYDNRCNSSHLVSTFFAKGISRCCLCFPDATRFYSSQPQPQD